MTDGDPVRALFDRYQRAVAEKDAGAFLALYEDDVIVFDTWGRWSYDGVTAWREMVDDWFGGLGDERVAVECELVSSLVGGDIAATNAFVTYRGLAADGSELRAMQNRLTWVLRRRGDGGWGIVHEHSSAPADFESGRVMLRR